MRINEYIFVLIMLFVTLACSEDKDYKQKYMQAEKDLSLLFDEVGRMYTIADSLKNTKDTVVVYTTKDEAFNRMIDEFKVKIDTINERISETHDMILEMKHEKEHN